MEHLLELKGIHAGYNGLNVLLGINLEVNKKEIVAIIGPNGAGKSTIIKAIFNIAQVKKGDILFKGRDITRLETHKLMKEGIYYVTQGRIIFENLTVRENLEIGANNIKDKEILKNSLLDVYKRFPILKERENALAYTLSGGQRQMLAIARALMQKPALLLLDEPSLGLSPKLQKEIFAMIQKLKEDGITIVIVEQNAKKAIEIADRTYLLEDGKIALKGGKEILKHKKIKSIYLGGRY